MEMKYLLTLISTMLLFSACSKDDGGNTGPAHRTVMVYMSSDNNLSGYVQSDINEMINGASGIPQNNNLVLFVDRSKKGEMPFIAKVTGNASQPLDTLYKYPSDFYASDPAKFSEVLQRITALCPANEYALSLWGHGTGWSVDPDSIASRSPRRAYGYDEANNKGYWMNITQMATALKSLPKFKFIFADCCNMASAEVAYELKDATEYLIASPAEIPGDGAPYSKIIPYLFKDGSNMYQGIIDEYYNYYYSSSSNTSLPLAAIDTKYISDLADRTHDILERATDGYPQYPELPDLSGIAFYFAIDGPVMYDMRAFIERIVSADDFKVWDATYQQAVPYCRMSMKWKTVFDGSQYPYNLVNAFKYFDATLSYGCMSMFIPLLSYGYDYGVFKYNKTSINFGWNRVMDWSRFGWEF